MTDEVSGRKNQAVAPREGNSRDQGAACSLISVYKSSEEDSVEAKSSKKSSVYKSSEEYFVDALAGKTVKHCEQCKTEGDEIEGVGYCKDCNKYLCRNCYQSHSRSKLTIHHALEDTKDNTISDRDVESPFAKMELDEDATRDQKSQREYTDIYTKSDRDEEICYITAMTMVSNVDLVLCDRNNKSLKLVDVENNIIKYILGLEEQPGGITTISTDEIAFVLLNKRQIHTVSVNEGLKIVRTVKTKGNCVDVKHVNGMLYVSFVDPIRFQSIKLTGKVKKKIKPNSEVLKQCKLPRYIAVSPDASLVYASDWTTNNVMCIDIHGCMISMHQGELDHPNDITISPSGSVYLCNGWKHTVNMMTSDLKQSTVILGPVDGIRYPVAMCFNEAKTHIYISSASDIASYRNCIKVIKVNGWK